MDRRIPAAVALALLAVLAGCAGGGGTATPGPDATATPTATDGPTVTGGSTPTATAGTTPAGNTTPTATPTPTPDSYQYPDGYAASGVTGPQAATAAHAEAMAALSSYTVNYDQTVATDNATVIVDYDQPTDLAAERAIRRFNVTSPDQFYRATSQYFTSDTVYIQSRTEPDRATYRNVSQPFNTSALTASGFVGPVLTDVSYGEATVVERDGMAMARYRATGLEAATALFGEGVSAENVTSFSATLFVSEDGIVRRVEYAATVDSTQEIEATVAVSAVGETGVQRPGWVSQA